MQAEGASRTTLPPRQLVQPAEFGSFPYTIIMMIFIWALLGFAYMISRWRQKSKATYIIPRVFVLCSPRTLQFHYELILRVGLPSYEFNPDKHDIDITVQGNQRSEIVPMTRLNTKTLLDEPLITSLSMIVYRLVEMPPLVSLGLRHSGPFKAWLYAYDFTVIDLSTNKEQYYTINQYIGSLNRTYALDEPNGNNVHYPIDDVPLPQWTPEDMYLILFTIINFIMLSNTLMPINCSYSSDIISIVIISFNCGCVIFFLDWIVYYYARWNQDRREYFNQLDCWYCPSENAIRIGVGIFSILLASVEIYIGFAKSDWKSSLVWLLTTLNSCILVIGFWNLSRQAEMGEALVALGLRIRGVEMVPVGMKYSEIVSDVRTKSRSASDEGGSVMSDAGKIAQSIGIRSSVKSFGFDPITGHPSRRTLGKALVNSSHS